MFVTGIVLMIMLGATPAPGAAEITLDPSSTLPGGYITVDVYCDFPADDGWIDAPQSFGQKFLKGKSSVDVRVPKGTPPGSQPVYLYCSESDEDSQGPDAEATLTVEGDVPDTGPSTGDGTTAMGGGPITSIGAGLLAAVGAAAAGAVIVRRRRGTG